MSNPQNPRPARPKLTDDAVADLPLHHGRAELLEEIMSTPVIDDTPVRQNPPRSTSRWLTPLAAAAVVAALATVPLWWGSDTDPSRAGAGPAAQGNQADQAPAEATDYVILTAPGWVADYTSQNEFGGEVSYRNGRASFEINRAPARLYAEYVVDREHIVDPPAPGDPVEVLGLPGQLWAYSADDHTVIREVEDGAWLEFRGSGMDRRAYLDLLGQLRPVTLAEFEASLPEAFVTTQERAAVVEEMVDGIATALAPSDLTPERVPESAFDSDETDRYQLGAQVAGVVACSWLASYSDAEVGGDTDQMAAAVSALATARDWPILIEMDREGDYSEVVYDYADQIAAGNTPAGFEGGLGCP